MSDDNSLHNNNANNNPNVNLVSLSEWSLNSENSERMNLAAARELELAAGEEMNRCSYIEGYIEQCIFTCLKCYPTQLNDEKNNSNNNYSSSIGFCLGCSMNCHVDCGESVIELYLKRDFRCDCGNEKCGGQVCSLDSNKQGFNYNNKYNHNFVNKYCHCNGSHDEGEEIMFSCLFCQDWFHDRCLMLKEGKKMKIITRTNSEIKENPTESSTLAMGDNGDNSESKDSPVPSTTDITAQTNNNQDESTFTPAEDQEFICRKCISLPKYNFLLPYLFPNPSANIPLTSSNDETNENKQQIQTITSNIHNNTSFPLVSDLSGWMCQCQYFNDAQSSQCFICEKAKPSESLKRKLETIQNIPPPPTNPPIICRKFVDRTLVPSTLDFDLFAPSNWAESLCRCESCLADYTARECEWILDLQEELEPINDTINLSNSNNNNNSTVSHVNSGNITSQRSRAFISVLNAQLSSGPSAESIRQTNEHLESIITEQYNNLPRAAVLNGVERTRQYMQRIAQQTQDFHEKYPNIPITAEQIKLFAQIAKQQDSIPQDENDEINAAKRYNPNKLYYATLSP